MIVKMGGREPLSIYTAEGFGLRFIQAEITVRGFDQPELSELAHLQQIPLRELTPFF